MPNIVFAQEAESIQPAPAQIPNKPHEVEKTQIPEQPAFIPPMIPPATSFTPEQTKALVLPKEDNYVVLNFDGANLRDVINTISSITGESFILSPGLEGRITIHSAKKIPVSEVLSVFESILEVNGIAMVRSGSFYKIVAGSVVRQKPLEVYKGKDTTISTDKPVTQIIPVEYIPATEASMVLQSMLSQFGSIIPNPRNNLLIINDLASNISRLLNILGEIDVNAFQNTRMRFFQPKYSDVKTLSKELTEIVNTLNLGREGIALVPLERINGLIVFSSSTSLLNAVEGWIKKLDESVTAGQNIFVYRVQNVKAESIANILKALYEAEEGTKPAAVTAPDKKPAPKAPAPVKPEEATGYSKVKIITYEPTNSLIILASPGVFRDMEETIRKLDVYPKAVLIEVLIAEVTLTDTTQFGIQWSLLHGISAEGDVFQGLTQTRSSQFPSYTIPPTLGTGSASASTSAAGLTHLIYKPDRLIAMIHALASKGKVNVLSSPRLLVRDQQEASIDVGSEIPTATSSSQTTETTSTVTQSIQYKTVGVKLKIKPNINDEKTVVLDVTQEVSDYSTDVTVGQANYTYPAFSKREIKTSVVVPDQQGLIIGGIIKERKSKSYQGIPLLSSIPLLGYLFRYTVDTADKTELVIILTPHVVSTKEEANIVTDEFLDKIKDLKKSIEKYKEGYKREPSEDEDKTGQSQ